jgi:hypothetical protein
MSADMQHAERQLQETIRSADRQRRMWVAVAAAAVAVVVVGVALAVNRPPAQPAQPPPAPTQKVRLTGPIPFDKLSPPLTVRLPQWITSADNDLNFRAGEGYSQHDGDRAVRLFSVGYLYPLDATKITKPTYATLVQDWKDIQTHGYGNVTDVATTTVDGKAATTMTVRTKRQADAFVYCEAATSQRTDPNACAGVFGGRNYHVAIVDQGTSEPPTLFWESSTTDFTANAANSNAALASEFAAWLATVRFS